MWHKVIFVGTILGLILIGGAVSYFGRTSGLLRKYQHYGFVQSQVQYKSVEKSWGDQGLIFYQLTFPLINIPNRADRMSLKLNDEGAQIHIKKLHLNVTQALNNLYGAQQMPQQLKNYTPYHDFFHKILTSMALMGMDEFVGDIRVNTTYSDLKTMNFTVLLDQQGHSTMQVSGVIHIPVVGAHQLSDLWRGKLDSAQIKVLDSNLLNKYMNYVKSRRIKIPDSFNQGIMELKNLSKRLPSLGDIWH